MPCCNSQPSQPFREPQMPHLGNYPGPHEGKVIPSAQLCAVTLREEERRKVQSQGGIRPSAPMGKFRKIPYKL